MKSTLIATRTEAPVVAGPPLFVTLCVLIWVAALVLAFVHPATTADLDTISTVVAP